jgi:hypothetical protein
MDPRRISVLSGALNSYRHEMLMENTQGIPIVQQHGEKDDNVPAYHSRFLAQMLNQSGSNPSYFEIPGAGHYFDTVMTTDQLVQFYRTYTNTSDRIPRRIQNFSFTIADPADMGSKGGIHVTHLDDPGQYGKIEVTGHAIRTSNVLSLEFDPDLVQLATLSLDGQQFGNTIQTLEGGVLPISRGANGLWQVSSVGLTD